MRTSLRVAVLSLLVLAGTHAPDPALAETPPATRRPTSPSSAAFDALIGRWVRPDGGYTVTIERVGEDGRLEASYANPRPLPFSRAEATRDGDVIEVFLELTAGGYGGSTYRLVYDPEQDLLRGVYYQAVARQRYDIYFERAK